MNYAQLFETIKGYVENDFPNTSWTDSAGTGTATLTSKEQVDTFIQQAEQRIYNTVELLVAFEQTMGTFTIGDEYLATPADWLSNFSFAVVDSSGNYEYLINKDINFIRAAYPNPNSTGLPAHYAYFDNDTFIVGPTPDDDYSYELQYFRYPESIVTAGTSWLGDNFDSALVYGTLLEAYTFMKGEEDVMKHYQARYNDAIAQLKELAEGKNRQDGYRSGRIRLPVR
jgi:hypothetical protein